MKTTTSISLMAMAVIIGAGFAPIGYHAAKASEVASNDAPSFQRGGGRGGGGGGRGGGGGARAGGGGMRGGGGGMARPSGGRAQGMQVRNSSKMNVGSTRPSGGRNQINGGASSVRGGDRTNIQGGNRNNRINTGNINTGNVNVNRGGYGYGGGGYYGGGYHGGYYGGDWDDDNFGAGLAVGAITGLAVGAAVASNNTTTVVQTLPSNCVTVVNGGATYMQCGSTWYQPQYSGSTVQYINVNPPY